MKVIIIGGGAAGMLAAYQAAKCGNDVSLYEKNEKLVGQVTILFLYNRVKRGEFKNKEAGKPPGSCVRGDESVRYHLGIE